MLKSASYRVVGLLVSAVFLYLAVRQVDLSQVLRAFGSVQLWLLAAAALVFLSGYPVRALRWRRVLQSQKELSVWQTLVPVFVGYMANNILPARVGEIYRAHFLGRRSSISRSGVMASIVVERAFDGLMLVVVIALVFFMYPEQEFLGVAALLTGLVFVVLAGCILFYVLVAERTHETVDRGFGLLPLRLREVLQVRFETFLLGMRGVSTASRALEVGAYTVLVWVLEASAMTLAVVSFGISLPATGYLLVYGLAALGTTLPSGPGYVGPYQYSFVLSLGVFEVSKETALAASVATQVALLGSVTLIGLALLWREHLVRAIQPERDGPEERG